MSVWPQTIASGFPSHMPAPAPAFGAPAWLQAGVTAPPTPWPPGAPSWQMHAFSSISWWSPLLWPESGPWEPDPTRCTDSPWAGRRGPAARVVCSAQRLWGALFGHRSWGVHSKMPHTEGFLTVLGTPVPIGAPAGLGSGEGTFLHSHPSAGETESSVSSCHGASPLGPHPALITSL